MSESRAWKPWTQEELFILENGWGKHSMGTLCRKLNRTPEGVRDMAVKKLKLGPVRNAQGLYTARQIADIAGVTHETIRKWIAKKNLPAISKSYSKNRKYYQIDLGEFLEWAKAQDLPSLRGVMERVG